MLVLLRKVGESIVIGEGHYRSCCASISDSGLSGDRVRLEERGASTARKSAWRRIENVVPRGIVWQNEDAGGGG